MSCTVRCLLINLERDLNMDNSTNWAFIQSIRKSGEELRSGGGGNMKVDIMKL